MFKSKYTIAAILLLIVISISNIFSIVYVEYSSVSLVEFREHRIECGPLLDILQNNIEYSKFLMIGNSMRSDIVPVVKIGGNAVHIPYLTTWEHEKDHPHVDLDKYSVLKHIGLLPEFIRSKKWHHRL